MKEIKICFVIALLVASLTGIYVAASCSASATRPGCNASCSITAPPGGSCQCTSGPLSADCKAFDAAGNLCNQRGCVCTQGGAIACYLMINPTC